LSNEERTVKRRDFNKTLLGAAAAPWVGDAPIASAALQTGKAKACIFIWLGGGMCHVDTIDPKAVGDPLARMTGSAYRSIPTAINGVEVCEHLKRTAPLLDRGVVVRTLNHPLFVDHADSTNLVKTGRLTSGTVVYPSIGSVVSHQLGPRGKGIPPYVVMGYPTITRGPGFLGGKHSYIYLTDTKAGPVGLNRPNDVTDARQRRRLRLLGLMRRNYVGPRSTAKPITDYDATIDAAIRLTGPEFTRVFELDREAASLRQQYGSEFGQRCLLARRLVEAGTRFVEVSYNLNFKNGTGWDTHRHGQKNQHLLIEDLDRAISSLVVDLEGRKLLDETLIVVATEFGRPAEFDGQGGRGHQSSTFGALLFGGGLKTGQAIGASDELGQLPERDPVSIPDFHATIHTALGIDPAHELHADNRPIPITDHGKPIDQLFPS